MFPALSVIFLGGRKKCKENCTKAGVLALCCSGEEQFAKKNSVYIHMKFLLIGFTKTKGAGNIAGIIAPESYDRKNCGLRTITQAQRKQ